MPYQKQQELQAARNRDRRETARNTLKKYSTGKRKGMAQETIKDAKNLAESMTPWGALSLAMQVSIGDWMYMLALLAAVFKDILDLVEFAGITYIIVFIATFCVSIFIAMMMLLGSMSHGQGRAQQKIIRSWLTLLAGTTVELLFGINFLPIETMTVLIIWGFTLTARKAQKKSS